MNDPMFQPTHEQSADLAADAEHDARITRLDCPGECDCCGATNRTLDRYDGRPVTWACLACALDEGLVQLSPYRPDEVVR